jgi:hypothetical protein
MINLRLLMGCVTRVFSKSVATNLMVRTGPTREWLARKRGTAEDKGVLRTKPYCRPAVGLLERRGHGRVGEAGRGDRGGCHAYDLPHTPPAMPPALLRR